MPNQTISAGTEEKRRRPFPKPRRGGLAQLSVIEHALCPLDESQSLQKPLIFDTGYFRSDRNGRRPFIPVQIVAQEGLSATDEMYLWGLLALTFSQKNPDLQLWATPHWCLKRLGLLKRSKGGKNYALFRQALRRVAGITYYCDRFYDPTRNEDHRRAFGFLKYDLPLWDDSSRAWRLVWDPLFFEYCVAKGGHLSFDLETYRQLNPASRRLFLLLTKVFWRRKTSPRFDVRHLAVHGLGFAEHLEMRWLKVKLARCIKKLADVGVVRFPEGCHRPRDLFEKKTVGSYAIQLQRGPYFERNKVRLTGMVFSGRRWRNERVEARRSRR